MRIAEKRSCIFGTSAFHGGCSARDISASMHVMFQDEYDKVEKPALDQLQQYGWLYVHGSELTPDSIHANGFNERAYMRDVVLVQRLEAAIQRIGVAKVFNYRATWTEHWS